MGGFLSLLVAYLFGGLTLLPLLAVAFYIYTTAPVGDPDPAKLVKAAISSDTPASDRPSPAEEAAAKHTSKGLPPRYGWLTVRKSFKPRAPDKDAAAAAGSSSPASHTDSASTTTSTYTNLLRSVRSSSSKDALGKDGSPTPAPSHSYVPPPEFFYTALKGSILYLYTSETLEECHAVLDLQQHDVTFYPIDGLMDGEIYAKRNAIHLKPKKRSTASSIDKSMSLGTNADEGDNGGNLHRVRSPTPLLHPSAWFIFVQANIEMEDWYFALKHASSETPHAPTLEPLAPVFSEGDMRHLIDTLDAEPDQIPMRWFNAVFGRIFLGINRTAWLEDFIKSKLHKKLHRLALPSFLSPLTVTQVSLSSPPPSFSRPMLKDLTAQGEASIEVGVSYAGELRVSVTTTATLSLGGRFKSYQVPLVLAVVVKEIEGDLRVRVKGPPSNRLWYGFSGEPKMTINVEPVVGAAQIRWSLILKPIEKQLREVFNESVVLPNMDDIPFFNTSRLTRGGIFQDAARTDTLASTSPAAGGSIDPSSESAADPESREAVIPPPAQTPSLFSGSLRKRQNTASSVDSEAAPAGHAVTRHDTAPPSLEHPQAATSLPKKTWFGSKPHAESLRSVSARAKEHADDQSHAPVASSSASLASTNSTPEKDLIQGKDDVARGRAASIAHEADELSRAAPRASSSSSARSPSPAPAQASQHADHATNASTSSPPNLTAASVVTAWRNRSTDKQALANLGAEARNAAKKWGATWTNKRKGAGSGEQQQVRDSEAPAAGPIQSHGRAESAGSAKDLFGRLAAQLATPAQHPASDTPGTPPTSGMTAAPAAAVRTSPHLPSLTRTPSPSRATPPARTAAGEGSLGRSASLRSVDRPAAALRSVPAASRGPTTALSDERVSSSSPTSEHPPVTLPVPAPPPLPLAAPTPVRTQLGASKMMSIPSIPAARRSAEQSFSSRPVPPPPSLVQGKEDTGGTGVECGRGSFEGRRRLDSVYRLFGSVSGAAATASTPATDSTAVTPAPLFPTSAASDPEPSPTTSTQKAASSTPPLPSRSPAAAIAPARTRSSSLSSSQPISVSTHPTSATGSGARAEETQGERKGEELAKEKAEEALRRIAMLDRQAAAAAAAVVNARRYPAQGLKEDDEGGSPDLPLPASPTLSPPALPAAAQDRRPAPPPLPPRTPSASSLPAAASASLVALSPAPALPARPAPPAPPTPSEGVDGGKIEGEGQGTAPEPVVRSRADSEAPASVDGVFAYDEH